MLLSFKRKTRLTAGFCDFRRRDIFRKTMGSIIFGFPSSVPILRNRVDCIAGGDFPPSAIRAGSPERRSVEQA